MVIWNFCLYWFSNLGIWACLAYGELVLIPFPKIKSMGLLVLLSSSSVIYYLISSPHPLDMACSSYIISLSYRQYIHYMFPVWVNEIKMIKLCLCRKRPRRTQDELDPDERRKRFLERNRWVFTDKTQYMHTIYMYSLDVMSYSWLKRTTNHSIPIYFYLASQLTC